MRLPRKRKKEVKKIVARKMASKMAMTAMVTAQACVQTAIIVSNVFPQLAPTMVGYKALRAAEVAMQTVEAIGKILSEPPNSWKDFIKN